MLSAALFALCLQGLAILYYIMLQTEPLLLLPPSWIYPAQTIVSIPLGIPGVFSVCNSYAYLVLCVFALFLS